MNILAANRFKLPLFNRIFQLSSKLNQQFSYQLIIKENKQAPILTRKPDSVLVNNWWSEPAFDQTQPLELPVFDFLTGDFTGKTVQLEQDIFNLPLRRDIVHSVLHWQQNFGLVHTHVALRKGTVAGSGKKPSQQKGSGRARTGNKRAPGRYHQGKAHGPVARDMTYYIPEKVKLLGIKTMLSAKLAEGKLRILNSEQISEPKTKIIAQSLKQQQFNESRILMVPGYKLDENFERAYKNIQELEVLAPHKLDIFNLLKFERLFITLDGLRQVTEDIQDRKQLLFTRKNQRENLILPSQLERQSLLQPQELEGEKVVYDPSKPLQFKFKILEDYLKDYEKSKTQNI